jgi:predicted AlkP superfamily phosphohydrolase/phosphomutase
MRAIIEEGIHGPLRTLRPTHSAIIWTSVATGKHYRKHGVDGFAYYNIPGIQTSLQVKETLLERLLIPLRQTKRVRITPFSSEARRCEAFWNILSRYGLSVGVVNWMGCWPVDPVNGFMVSNRFLTAKTKREGDELPGLIWPDSLQQRALERFHLPADDRLPHFVDDLDATDDLFSDFIRALEHLEREVQLTIALGEAYDPDVLLFYEHFLDSIQHRFWRFMEPEHYDVEIPADQVERYGGLIRLTYMYFDHAVGRLIEELGDDWDVVILSDHGMEPIPLISRSHPKVKKQIKSKQIFDIISAHHNQAPPGILIAKGAGIRKGEEVTNAGIYDILPTLLYSLGLPIASDMDGQILEEIFEESYLAEHSPTVIPTYETKKPTAGRRLSRSVTDEEILEKFRALGYIQ